MSFDLGIIMGDGGFYVWYDFVTQPMRGHVLGFMCGGQFSFRTSLVEMDPRYDSLDVLSFELTYLHGLGGTQPV